LQGIRGKEKSDKMCPRTFEKHLQPEQIPYFTPARTPEIYCHRTILYFNEAAFCETCVNTLSDDIKKRTVKFDKHILMVDGLHLGLCCVNCGKHLNNVRPGVMCRECVHKYREFLDENPNLEISRSGRTREITIRSSTTPMHATAI